MKQQVCIGFRRRLASAFAIVFAIVAVDGAWQAGSSNDLPRLLIILTVFGGACCAYLAQALRRDPVLLLDDEGLTDRRRGDTIRWSDIKTAHVMESHGRFDRYHDLVLTVGRGQTMSLSLDQLTRTWGEVVEMVEGRLGRRVAVVREGGVLRRWRGRVLAG
jgi:hypothetical protein